MEADILRMEGIEMTEQNYHVVLLEDPAQTVFSIRRRVGVDGYHDLFIELRQELARRGLRQAGPIQMLYHDQDFDLNSSDVEAQAVVAGGDPACTVKPACTCAAVIHRGSYEGLHLAYSALLGWMAEHPEYRICGPAMDRYFNDPHTVSEEELETGVLFPVEKVG